MDAGHAAYFEVGAGSKWQRAMVGPFWWCVNPNSGDTGGILEGDWRTWNAGKLALLQRLMQ